MLRHLCHHHFLENKKKELVISRVIHQCNVAGTLLRIQVMLVWMFYTYTDLNE